MTTAGLMQIPDGDLYFTRVFARTGDKFQQDLLKAALQYVRSTPRCAIDIGAHVGSWTRQLTKHFSDVIAFEPHPENFRCLRENTKGMEVTRMSVALGAESGECDMAQHAGNSGCWRVIKGRGVQVQRLDDFRFTGVDLIKIDVEGLEGAVIRGATKTIHEYTPVIVFEDNGLGQKFYGADWIDPKPILASLGYRMRLRLKKDEIWTI